MTNTEKLNALLGCVYTPNCCVTGFQSEAWGKKAKLFLSNGLTLRIDVDSLEILKLDDTDAA